MTSNTWKKFERDAGRLIGATRFAANQGGRIDVEGERALGQCKYRRSLSHGELSRLAQEMDAEGRSQNKLGVVLHQVPPGRGRATKGLITMTWEQFDQWFRWK